MVFTRPILIFALLTFSLPAFAHSGEKGHDRGQHPPPEQMHKRMKEARGKMLRDHLGLNAEVVGKIEEILHTYDPQRHELHKKKHQAHRQLRELLDADSYDQAAYAEALTNLRTSHAGLSKLRGEEMDRLAEVLTPKQQAKLALAFKRMKRKMHKFRRGKRHKKEKH